jgi:hypothetical protein
MVQVDLEVTTKYKALKTSRMQFEIEIILIITFQSRNEKRYETGHKSQQWNWIWHCYETQK